MTTHVFIVNEKSFPVHLNYLFAGTGAKDKDSHIGLLADISRVRKNDIVIFYLEKIGFFGTFKIDSEPFWDNRKPSYLENLLGKKLIYRVRIKPNKVMPKFVSEWEALDKLPLYAKDIIWSLIYRKFKAWRGCTPITLQESDRLIQMIENRNKGKYIKLRSNESLTYNLHKKEVEKTKSLYQYRTNIPKEANILSEMINLDNKKKSFESHLEAFFTKNAGINKGVNKITGGKTELIWIGNQVYCGVGMQKIDVFTVISDSRNNLTFNLIELKCKPANPDILKQIERYVLWAQSYIHNAINSNIQPVIVTRKIIRDFRNNGKPLKVQSLRDKTKSYITEFNKLCLSKPVLWFEFDFKDKDIIFNKVDY